jgi:cytidine deaminase
MFFKVKKAKELYAVGPKNLCLAGIIMNKTLKNLLAEAYKARTYAYAPYSKYAVGCAILLDNNEIIRGANIENAAYSVALCAERVAMACVIAKGQQHLIKALAVATDSFTPASPCGACRQFLSEFLSPDLPIIFGNEKQSLISTMSELLPFAFNKEALAKYE